MADQSTPVAELVTRYGEKPTATVQYDEKGRPYFMQSRKCGRCGGAGSSDRWAHTGYTCFDCQGSGNHKNGPIAARLYTAEEVAVLDGRRNKARAKKQAALDAQLAAQQAEAARLRDAFLAEHGALIERANRYLAAILPITSDMEEYEIEFVEQKRAQNFVGDIIRRAERTSTITPAQIDAITTQIDRYDAQERAKAASRHVGEVGERLTLVVDVVSVKSFERKKFNAPWLTETVVITKMRDEAGNTFMVFSPSFRADRGAKLKIKGTVKDHDSYEGECQTKLARPSIIETLVAPAAATE